MKTLVLGAAIVDIIMKIPKLPKSGEDVLCTERKLTVGEALMWIMIYLCQ